MKDQVKQLLGDRLEALARQAAETGTHIDRVLYVACTGAATPEHAARRLCAALGSEYQLSQEAEGPQAVESAQETGPDSSEPDSSGNQAGAGGQSPAPTAVEAEAQKKTRRKAR